jgi:hypothetical protein
MNTFQAVGLFVRFGGHRVRIVVGFTTTNAKKTNAMPITTKLCVRMPHMMKLPR